MRDKSRKFWLWLKKEILRKDMIVYILIAEIVFWLPAIFCILMSVFDNWWWAGFTGYVAFWALPIISPAIPMQVGLIFLVKKIIRRLR